MDILECFQFEAIAMESARNILHKFGGFLSANVFISVG